MVLRSQLVDLWKFRVQHLRQYYCFHGHKPKQKSSPAISRHVWFIPLILTLWWLLIAVIFLYTLKMEHLLSTGEVLRYMLYLNYLLTVLWWKLAVTESEGTTKTRFRNGPHCSCTMCTNHQNGCTIARGNVSMVILPLRHNWKCYRRRRVLQTVRYSDHQVVTSLLLILAGDVETNPGPGIDADDTTILALADINEVMDELKDVLACYEGIGGRLNIPNDKLEEIRGQNLRAAAAMRRVIVEWLNRNYPNSSSKPPTWKALVDAIEHPVGGNNKAEAEEIASRHRTGSSTEQIQQKPEDTQDHHTPAGSHDEKEDESPETCYLHQEKFGKLAEQSSLSQEFCQADDEEPAAKRLKLDEDGSHDEKEDESILTPETCYLHQEKVGKLACRVEQSSLRQGAFNWPPKQSYLARIKEKTEDIEWKFIKLRDNFLETLSTTTNKKNFYRRCHMILDILSIDPKTKDEIKASNNVEKLLDKICEHQSFMNFGILVKRLIPELGSEEDNRNANNYIKFFEEHVNCRVIDCSKMYPSVLSNHFKIAFIINENQNQYKIGNLFTFRLHLSKYIGIDDTKILLVGCEGGSVIVHVQIPYSFLKMLLCRPLYPKKLEAFKDTSVRSYCFKDHEKDHEVVLKHWKTLKNVSLPPTESSPVHEKQGKIIKSAHHQGEECMALVYPNQFSEEFEVDFKYIEYLEVLIRDHKEVPSIKGLYYPPEEGGLKKYPVVIIEKLKFLEEITFHTHYDELSIDLLQISLLSNIASAAKRFEKLNHKVKVSTDHILIVEDDAEYKAKFIPVYGHSFTDEIPSNQYSISESLPHDDLLWLKKIIHIVSHGGSTSHVEIPDKHFLKNMIEQKWLSEDTQFRPHTYSELADELQHLLETEKTWIGMIKISADGDLVEDEVQIHVILIGHTGVGKTSLRKNLKDEPIDDNETPTIVMQPEFLYRESMAAVTGSAFKPLLDLPSDCQSKVFLTMWDTGGQPIFQDLLPCFVRLKCMYGIVFRLSDLENFDNKPEIRRCKSFLEPSSSPFTNRDIMYRNLSFVQAFSSSAEKKMENLPPQVKSRDSQKVSTAAVVVGTCKDQAVLSGGHSLQDKKDALDKAIGKFAKKYRNDLSLYTVLEQGESYIHEVDNTKSGKKLDRKVDSGIESLRNTISSCAKDSRSEIPRSWQAFKLVLQRMCYTEYINIGIIPLDEAISIGKNKCCVDEPKAALMYFHELGVFMWHHLSERRMMRKFVVIDPRALLQVLGTLFCYDPRSLKPEWSKFTKKGIIPMSFYRYLLDRKPSKLDDQWFMEFLEEHHLSMKVNFPGEEICYFIPSILPIKEEYGSALEQLNGDVSPLYIVPESGYIATGVFTRLLTALAGVTYGNTRWRIPLNYSKECIESCRNQFEFIINDCMHVILSEFSHHIRVDCVSYDNANSSEDIYYHILSTLNVQLQRIVPRWLEKREFDITLACKNESCSSTAEHFYLIKKLTLESDVCECSNGLSNELKKSELVWFRSETVSEMSNDEAAALFDTAIKSGFLNLRVATVLFFGVSGSGIATAKHIALQEHVPTTPKTTSLVEHEIYFRAANQEASIFKKFETNHHDEILVFTMSSEDSEANFKDSASLVFTSTPGVGPKPSPSPETSSLSLHSPKLVDDESAEEKHTNSSEPIKNVLATVKHEEEIIPESDLIQKSFNLEQSLNDTKQFMSQYKNKGKMELLHVIDCGPDFIKLQEILELFIKNVTLHAFVTNLSKGLNQSELNSLLQAKTQCSNLQIVGTCEMADAESASKKAFLQQMLGDLQSIFQLKCKSPQRKDYDIGSSIIERALSASAFKKLPFSWYTFGFKLRECVASTNLSIMSVSEHCMKIGKELNMDRPTVEAALEHLTEHNMILYFKDILPNIAFSGISIFSKIFSSLYNRMNSSKSSIGWQSSIINREDFHYLLGFYTNKSEFISEDDFLLLFRELMILAPYDGDSKYVIPFLLQPLDEAEQQQVSKAIDSKLNPAIIKCPTAGNQFFSMMMSCLSKQSWIIAKDQSGNPVRLYKNCATFRATELNCVVTISFISPYIEVYVKSDNERKPANYHLIASIILQCLEKIKLINGHIFDSNIRFYCNCRKTSEKHTCSFHKESGYTSMECERNSIFSPDSSQLKWLGGEKYREPLTVSNAANMLLRLSNKWIVVASSLGLPSSAIDVINVSSRRDNQVALRKVMEWWFMNTANPEWNQIHQVLNQGNIDVEGLPDLKKMCIRESDFSILDSLVEVTNWRDLGVQLGLKPARLKALEEYPEDQRKLKMILQWLKADPDASWEKLQAVLEKPSLCENRAAKGIAERRQGGFSTDSVISFQSRRTAISDDIEFNEANVRNAIAHVENIQLLGEQLKIPPSILVDIDKLPPDMQKHHLVEALFRVHTDTDCDWKILEEAIRFVDIYEWISWDKRSESRLGSFPTEEFPMSPPQPYKSGNHSIDQADLLDHKVAERKNDKMILENFTKLKMKIIKNLTEAKLDMGDFHDFIRSLFETGDNIPKDYTVKQVFKELDKLKCWNFLDITGLESIVEMFDEDHEAQNMKLIKEYKEMLTGYKAVTKITDFILQHKSMEEAGQEYRSIKEDTEKYDEKYRSKLSIKLFGGEAPVKLSMLSLEYIEKLWNSLCIEFHMPSLPRLLDSIVIG